LGKSPPLLYIIYIYIYVQECALHFLSKGSTQAPLLQLRFPLRGGYTPLRSSSSVLGRGGYTHPRSSSSYLGWGRRCCSWVYSPAQQQFVFGPGGVYPPDAAAVGRGGIPPPPPLQQLNLSEGAVYPASPQSHLPHLRGGYTPPADAPGHFLTIFGAKIGCTVQNFE